MAVKCARKKTAQEVKKWAGAGRCRRDGEGDGDKEVNEKGPPNKKNTCFFTLGRVEMDSK